jgi:oligopeptide/dipeptide ABC transporter ATP-binding protein
MYNKAMTVLEVKNLNLGFDCECEYRQALFDVSFNLEKGNIHALVGESGCGKTISAMSILQLLPKTAHITGGEICFEGNDILTLPKPELQNLRGAKIALIPQDPMTSLNPLYTVGNQLIEVIKIHQGLDGKAAFDKAAAALETVHIQDAKTRMKSYPHEFSGGMKQRAIIAMALACNAEILIADEPTTALDVTIQAQIMSLLNEIKAKTAILLITHDLALVGENADFVSVMYAGRVVESAPVKEFFRAPSHPYSQALLRSLPSNTGQKLETIPGQPPTILQNISGCRFHPRCKKCMDVCTKEIPPVYELGNEHYSACFLQR